MIIKYSVIMPCYNAANYIKNTLNRFQRITAGRNDIELIIINDGSNDSTLELIKDISLPNLKIISTINKGVSNARNIGVKSAVGEFVMFLDSDDFYNSGIFDILDISLNDCDVLFFGYQTVTQDGGIKRKYSFGNLSNVGSNEGLNLLFKKELPVHVCATVIRKCVLESTGVLFNINIHHCEDLEFIIKTISSVNQISIISNVLYNYVDNPNSAVNKVIDCKQLSKFDVFESILPPILNANKRLDNSYYNYYVLSVYLLLMIKVLTQGASSELIVNSIYERFKVHISKEIHFPKDIVAFKIRTLTLLFRFISFIQLHHLANIFREFHVFKKSK
ncbi:glycosyltransferase family 2 protein [Scandinavium goeteborgense]|uniref:glycosyltransferase family 2 protein n=1 Tax=Scandinavium goeteborgense TaxID=1851514 RepID=UPI00380574CF